MELLGRADRGRRLRAGAAALLTALTGIGCAILAGGEGDAATLGFSHRRHVQDEGLECINCHEDALTADDPGMPSPDVCSLCHETIDAERPPERRIERLFADGAYIAQRVSRLEDEVVFSHLRHTAGAVECGDCHAGIESNEQIVPEMRVEMDDCMACHAERRQPAECATCHSVIGADWAPDSHAHAWDKLHGGVALAHSPEPAKNCELCHRESYCTACHQAQPPENHGNFFRRRGHGLIASMNRASCFACHRSDSCDRCHSEILPMSHAGQWGSQRNTHCLVCHFPLESQSCLVCHKATPSHLLAAPKPPDHHPAMNCRQCHGLTAPLPHVEKGDDCNACHL